MNAIFDFDPARSNLFFLTLLHFVWQIALLTLITRIASSIWRRRVARLFGEPLCESILISRKSAIACATIFLLVMPVIRHSQAESGTAPVENVVRENKPALVATSANTEEVQDEFPSSRRYQTDFGEIEVSIAMQKPEMMLGEPATMIVRVKNLADKQLFLARVQDRMLGRPKNFEVTATDSEGRELETRENEHVEARMLGDHSWKEAIPAGESWSAKFFLPDWFIFEETGDHRIDCKATLSFNSSDFDENRKLETADVEVHLSVPVTIVPNSMHKMATLIEELGRAAIADNPDEHAMKQLLAIDDNGVVEQLVKAIAVQRYTVRFHALQGLAKFNTDEALQGIEIGLATSLEDMRKNSGNDKVAKQLVFNIRHSAAVALSNSPHPKAEERLLSLWDDPYYAVRISVLHRLGKLKTDESMETLRKMTQDSNEIVRNEAIRYVKLREDAENKEDNKEGSVTRKMTIRVVDADGKAIKGARVFRNHVYQSEGKSRPKIENETYTSDMGGQAEIELSEETVDLRLWASAKGYTRLHAMWAGKFQADGKEIPDEFTFKMQRATTIGGTITDTDGKPIPGVTVEVRDKAAIAFHTLPPDQAGIRPVRDYSLTGSDGVLTDENGKWQINNVPADEVLGDDEGLHLKIELRITHPEFHGDDTPMNKVLGDETIWGEIQRAQGITRKSLRDQSATIKLKRRQDVDKEARFAMRWPAEWVSTITIDKEFVNQPMVEELSSDEVAKRFTDDRQLTKAFAASLDWDAVPDHDSWKKEQNEKLAALSSAPRDTEPLVKIVRFSKTHVEVKITRPVANYLWHHYYGVAKHLRIERSETIDVVFGLKTLEAKYLITYKGVGLGTSVMEARKALGEPDYTQQTQSPSWYTDYYFDDGVAVFYQVFAIHSINRKEIPASVRDAAAAEKRAKANGDVPGDSLEQPSEQLDPAGAEFPDNPPNKSDRIRTQTK